MPAVRHIPATAAAALALLAVGCGGSDKGLLKQSDADLLLAKTDQVERAIEQGGCQTAESRALEGVDKASQLRGVDGALQNNIVDGFEQLADTARDECEAAEDDEKEKPEKTPTPEPTEEVTEVPTEEPTEVPTEEPTEVPTEEPTEAPTVEIPEPEPTEDTGGVAVPTLGAPEDGG